MNAKSVLESLTLEDYETIFHDLGVQLRGVSVFGPGEEKGLRRIAEHLDKQGHDYGQFDGRLVDSQIRLPQGLVNVEKAEKNPVQKVVDNAG